MNRHAILRNEAVFSRIRGMFDVAVMQNNLRGLWVEAMVCELLGAEWRHTGIDWAAWDLEGPDGLRIEVKQSAMKQSWGQSTSSPRFNISAAQGHYPDGKTYLTNVSGKRLADIYIFAWHDGTDQRASQEWLFYIVDEKQLPVGQKILGLAGIQRIAKGVSGSSLRDEVDKVANRIRRKRRS